VATVVNNAPSSFPVGNTTVTWTVTDTSGNTATATQVVTINDTESPVVNAPAPIAVNNDAGLCSASVPFAAAPTDNCGVATTVYKEGTTVITSPHVFGVGPHTVNVTVTDIHGNTASGSFTVTVTDNTAPVVNAPAPIAVNNDAGVCTASVSFAAAPTDNCGVQSTVYKEGATEISSPHVFAVGPHTVTATVTDIHGNSASASFTVTVNDTQNPTITAPPALSLANDAGACGRALAHIALGTPVTGDNCGVASVSSNAPSSFPVGNTTVTWTVMDIHGRTATATQIVTINDTEAPELIDPANMTISDGNPAAFGTTATDNCGMQSIVYRVGSTVITSPCAFPVGSTVVDVTATDIHGNTATCQFTVTRTAASCLFTGFQSPIGGADATGGTFADPLRAFKLGSTVPVKFRLVCGGVPNTTGVHTLQAIKYSSSTTSDAAIDATPTDAATSGNQFRLTDASTGDWHFNLSTKTFTKGIWKLVATLSDGTQHEVWIEIKK